MTTIEMQGTTQKIWNVHVYATYEEAEAAGVQMGIMHQLFDTINGWPSQGHAVGAIKRLAKRSGGSLTAHVVPWQGRWEVYQ